MILRRKHVQNLSTVLAALRRCGVRRAAAAASFCACRCSRSRSAWHGAAAGHAEPGDDRRTGRARDRSWPLMIALPVLVAPFRALLGFRSDTHRSALGWKRMPYLWFGSLWQMGGLAVMPFALIVLSGDQIHGPAWAGEVLAALAFLMTGLGMHMTQTAGLALAADRATEETRPARRGAALRDVPDRHGDLVADRRLAAARLRPDHAGPRGAGLRRWPRWC